MRTFDSSSSLESSTTSIPSTSSAVHAWGAQDSARPAESPTMVRSSSMRHEPTPTRQAPRDALSPSSTIRTTDTPSSDWPRQVLQDPASRTPHSLVVALDSPLLGSQESQVLVGAGRSRDFSAQDGLPSWKGTRTPGSGHASVSSSITLPPGSTLRPGDENWRTPTIRDELEVVQPGSEAERSGPPPGVFHAIPSAGCRANVAPVSAFRGFRAASPTVASRPSPVSLPCKDRGIEVPVEILPRNYSHSMDPGLKGSTQDVAEPWKWPRHGVHAHKPLNLGSSPDQSYTWKLGSPRADIEALVSNMERNVDARATLEALLSKMERELDVDGESSVTTRYTELGPPVRRLSAVESSNASLKEKVRELESQVSEGQHEVSALSMQRETLEVECESQATELRRMSRLEGERRSEMQEKAAHRVAIVAVDVSQLHEHLERVESDGERSRELCATLEASVWRTQARAKELLSECSIYDGLRDKMELERGGLLRQIAELQAQSCDLETSRRKLFDENFRLQREQNLILNAQDEEEKRELATAKRQLQRLREEAGAAEASLALSKRSGLRETSRFAEVELEVAAIRSMLAVSSQRISSARALGAELQRQCRAEVEAARASDASCLAVSMRIKAMQDTVRELRAKQVASERSVASAETFSTRERLQLMQDRDLYKMLQDELSDVRRSTEATQRRFVEAEAISETRLTGLRHKENSKLTVLESEIQEARRNQSKARADMDDLKMALKQTQADAFECSKRQEAELHQTRSSKERLAKEVEALQLKLGRTRDSPFPLKEELRDPLVPEVDRFPLGPNSEDPHTSVSTVHQSPHMLSIAGSDASVYDMDLGTLQTGLNKSEGMQHPSSPLSPPVGHTPRLPSMVVLVPADQSESGLEEELWPDSQHPLVVDVRNTLRLLVLALQSKVNVKSIEIPLEYAVRQRPSSTQQLKRLVLENPDRQMIEAERRDACENMEEIGRTLRSLGDKFDGDDADDLAEAELQDVVDRLLVNLKLCDEEINFLHASALSGVPDALLACLAEVHEKGSLRETDTFSPIHWAAATGRRDIIQFMLEKDPHLVNMRDKLGRTPLDYAQSARREGLVHWLRGATPSVSRVDLKGVTKDTLVMVEQVEKQGWTSVRWENNYTLLHWSALMGHAELCQHLLRLEADPNLMDGEGRTPLEYAKGREVIDVLKSGRAIPPSVIPESALKVPTMADEASDTSSEGGIPEKYIPVMEQVQKYGWETVDWVRGYTLLHWASKNDKAELCSYFLHLRADPLAVDAREKTCFDYAREFKSHAALAALQGPSKPR